MYTLNEVIATLEAAREEIGGDAKFFLGYTGGTRSVEKADLYDIAGVYRTETKAAAIAGKFFAKAKAAAIMYIVPTSAALTTQVLIQRSEQTRVQVARDK